MVAQCTAHAQLKSVYGVSRVTCHREPGPPISMSKVGVFFFWGGGGVGATFDLENSQPVRSKVEFYSKPHPHRSSLRFSTLESHKAKNQNCAVKLKSA